MGRAASRARRVELGRAGAGNSTPKCRELQLFRVALTGIDSGHNPTRHSQTLKSLPSVDGLASQAPSSAPAISLICSGL